MCSCRSECQNKRQRLLLWISQHYYYYYSSPRINNNRHQHKSLHSEDTRREKDVTKLEQPANEIEHCRLWMRTTWREWGIWRIWRSECWIFILFGVDVARQQSLMLGRPEIMSVVATLSNFQLIGVHERALHPRRSLSHMLRTLSHLSAYGVSFTCVFTHIFVKFMDFVHFFHSIFHFHLLWIYFHIRCDIQIGAHGMPDAIRWLALPTTQLCVHIGYSNNNTSRNHTS